MNEYYPIIIDKDLLNKKCTDIIFKEGLDLGNLLLNVLSEHSNGIGLAAPQIGIYKNVFVMAIPNLRTQIFINPKITYNEQPILTHESCLSFPDKECIIIRSNHIHITYMDYYDYRHTNVDIELELWGMEAIVAQHEFDHLLGITILDKEIKL